MSSGSTEKHGVTGTEGTTQPAAAAEPDGSTSSEPQSKPQKPWPMSWILIVILAYVALQTAYFLFYGD